VWTCSRGVGVVELPSVANALDNPGAGFQAVAYAKVGTETCETATDAASEGDKEVLAAVVYLFLLFAELGGTVGGCGGGVETAYEGEVLSRDGVWKIRSVGD
jgi:hypothetical protein